MERLVCMFLQKISPHRVVSALKAGSAEIIWVYTRAKAIALRHHRKGPITLSRSGHTHRVRSPSHVLAPARDKEFHFLPPVNTVRYPHFVWTERNVYHEPPERECAIVLTLTIDAGRNTNGNVPSTTTINPDLLCRDCLLEGIWPDVIWIGSGTDIGHWIGGVRTQVE